MNKKGTRNTNGEGCIYTTIAKQKRKRFLDKECKICKECSTKCNRLAFEKCKKCENCKEECLKYCDRFYVYERNQAQITIDGKQTTVANEKKRKDAVSKKKETEAQIQTQNYIKKNGITILEVCKKIQENKFEAGKIGKNTKSKDKYHYKYIENCVELQQPVQKITYQDINNFLNSIRHLSQSEIEHIVNKLKSGFMQCVLDKIISYADNPMLRVTIPTSYQTKKRVEAFEIEEQRKLMNYIRSKPLIKSSICNYDEETLKNLFICLFLTGSRIGELGALDYNTMVDLNKRGITIKRTLSQENGKIIMGETTKTGKKKIEQGLNDERFIPFDLFDEKLMTETINNQLKVAKSNLNNKEHLLFCQLDGNYIDYRCLNNIFKRICREAGVKLNLSKGCHLHMCRHTATTRMLEAGMDLLVIAHILGHSDDKQIKETYGHLLPNYINKQLKNSRSYYAKNNLSA